MCIKIFFFDLASTARFQFCRMSAMDSPRLSEVSVPSRQQSLPSIWEAIWDKKLEGEVCSSASLPPTPIPKQAVMHDRSLPHHIHPGTNLIPRHHIFPVTSGSPALLSRSPVVASALSEPHQERSSTFDITPSPTMPSFNVTGSNMNPSHLVPLAPHPEIPPLDQKYHSEETGDSIQSRHRAMVDWYSKNLTYEESLREVCWDLFNYYEYY